MFLNSVFEEAVVANTDEVFDGCTFASGIVAKQKGVFGLTVGADANVVVKNSVFKNKGYSAIYMNSTGKIDIENNEFDCTGLYNPIEGASSASGAKLTNVNIKNNTFNGICGNNYMNFYNMEDGAVVNIENNVLNGISQQSEVIRLSNVANNSATFNVKDLVYNYDMNTEFDEMWTKMVLCQDYSTTFTQDFTKFVLNVDGVNCNGIDVKDAESFPVGGLMCVYDGTGKGEMYPVENVPVVHFN